NAPNIIMTYSNEGAAETNNNTLGLNAIILGSPDTEDPQLGPLQDNGGPTQTMAITANSPAFIHSGVTSSGGIDIPTKDQRGELRGIPPDLGAFESTKIVSVGTLADINSSLTTGDSLIITVDFNADSGVFVDPMNLPSLSIQTSSTTTALAVYD